MTRPAENDPQNSSGEPKKARSTQIALAHQKRLNREHAQRVSIQVDGSRRFLRFHQNEILEHWGVMVSVFLLGLTGLLLAFLPAQLLLRIDALFAGMLTLRKIHLLAATIFSLQALAHLVRILYVWFVKRQAGAMAPRLADLADLFQVLYYNLGFRKSRPASDRFSIDEKLGYWGVLAMGGLVGLSGLVQWFSASLAFILPVELILLARAFHSQMSLPLLGLFLVWHLYHTRVKENNNSIFTGWISEESMLENHPLEHQRIMTAFQKVQSSQTPPPFTAAREPEPVQDTPLEASSLSN
jgi:cytochrome b subunit of formate dehydrogenase